MSSMGGLSAYVKRPSVLSLASAAVAGQASVRTVGDARELPEARPQRPRVTRTDDTDLLLRILMSSIKGNSRATQEVTAMQGGGD